MGKIIDDFIKSTSLIEMPLCKYQCAYQSGKSTITALQSLVNKIEKSLEAKEIAVGAFLDIEGAFDNASYSFMSSAMEARGLDKSVIEWVMTWEGETDTKFMYVIVSRDSAVTMGKFTHSVEAT